jgi:hypothetical protein
MIPYRLLATVFDRLAVPQLSIGDVTVKKQPINNHFIQGLALA